MKDFLQIVLLAFAAGATCDAQNITNLTPEPVPYLFPPATVRFEGGSGSNIEDAVVIKGAVTVEHAVEAEKAWIRQYDKYYLWNLETQLVQEANNRKYHCNTYGNYEGPFTVYFDITDCLGKTGVVGRWELTFADNTKTNSSMTASIMDTSYLRLCSNKTVQVHCQQLTGATKGEVRIASLRNGQEDGWTKSWSWGDDSAGTYYSKIADGSLVEFYAWYTNGIPRYERHFTNRYQRVRAWEWHPNGRLQEHLEFHDGIPVITNGHLTWHPDGSLASRYYSLPAGTSKLDSNRWQVLEYFPDGRLRAVRVRPRNIPGEEIEWHENGNIKSVIAWDTRRTSPDMLGESRYPLMETQWATNGIKLYEYTSWTNDTHVERHWNNDGTLVSEGTWKDHPFLKWDGTFPRWFYPLMPFDSYNSPHSVTFDSYKEGKMVAYHNGSGWEPAREWTSNKVSGCFMTYGYRGKGNYVVALLGKASELSFDELSKEDIAYLEKKFNWKPLQEFISKQGKVQNTK